MKTIRARAASTRLLAQSVSQSVALALAQAVVLVSVGISLSACNEKTVWVYTSIYKDVLREMSVQLKQDLPDLDVRFFQGGSENVASRLMTEMAAGGSQADLVITSDPFWYLELKKTGKLLPYDSPAARAVPVAFQDPDHAFTTVRIPVMVIAHSETPRALKASPPTGWKSLAAPVWRDQLSMGSPLESGTSFTAVAMLARAFGWDYLAKLRRNELIAAGGNSSVINRIETRERPVGIVLLENVLKARKKKSPLAAVYPEDGAILIPSPIAILKESPHPDRARRVYDWFFSARAQAALVKSGMYSPLAASLGAAGSPEGAKPWGELYPRAMPWDPRVLEEIYGQREQIKAKFSGTVLH